MNKLQKVKVSDELFATLLQIARASSLSVDKVAEDILSKALIEGSTPSLQSGPIDFDIALSYALNKNEELLQRLAT